MRRRDFFKTTGATGLFIITRAIGPSNTVHPELSSCTALEKDLFLLCSDGLSDALSKSALEAILQEAQSLENAAQRMIEYAKLRGTGDNITVLMVQLR